MKENDDIEKLADRVLRLSNTIAVFLVMLLLIYFILLFNIRLTVKSQTGLPPPQPDENGLFTKAAREEARLKKIKAAYWQAPDVSELDEEPKKDLILYGKDLITHTSKYYGEHGTLFQGAINGMNCQNCHLEAGTKVFGNNYASVASTYPKLRARSGHIESIAARVNDCFLRSLNGRAIDTTSLEMKSIVSYILWLGKKIEKGIKPPGSGLKELAFLNRAADTIKGKEVYINKCQSCHQKEGQGLLNADQTEFTYPPLWGNRSYNDGAGLFRLSAFAKYVRFNMPFGADHLSPQLNDEEAWDVAAYVNSRPRPHKIFKEDWPDISKKPADYPFGPFADHLSEAQHKYGPFGSITPSSNKTH